jgi:gamma-polyglutamate synthase
MMTVTDKVCLTDFQSLAQLSLKPLDLKLLPEELNEINAEIDSLNGSLQERLSRLLEVKAEFRRNLVTQYRKMEKDLGSIGDNKARVDRMMAFLATFVPVSKLKQDLKAFDRWMDAAAVRERTRCTLHHSERINELIIKMLTRSIIEIIRSSDPDQDAYKSIKSLNLSELLWVEFDESPRWQNRVAVLEFWIRCADNLSPSERVKFLPERWEDLIVSNVRNSSMNLWIQAASLEMGVLYYTDMFIALAKELMAAESDVEDDFFVRARWLKILHDQNLVDVCLDFIEGVFSKPDGSQYVQIRAAKLLGTLDYDKTFTVLKRLLENSGKLHSKVTAVAVLSLGKVLVRRIRQDIGCDELTEVLDEILSQLHSGVHVLIQRAALESLSRVSKARLKHSALEGIQSFEHRILESLDRLISSKTGSHRIKNQAAIIRLQMILLSDPGVVDLLEHLREKSSRVSEGGVFFISNDQVKDEETLGHVLSLLSVSDFGYYARKTRLGYEITKGDRYQRRLWRVLDEIRHPDPSKRQGFLHSIGRRYSGTVRSHSRLLAETTQTKVTGERLYVPGEASWRSYLPTVDDLLSLTSGRSAGKPVNLFSAEGVVTIKGPRRMVDRIMLWLRITLDYRELARRRNLEARQLDSAMERSLIQVAIEDLGIEVSYRSHAYHYEGRSYSVTDPVVTRNLFPAVLENMMGSE